MGNVMVNFRMDEDLKREMEETCREMGLTTTAAYTIYAKAVTRLKRIPFEISAVEPNTETIDALNEVERMKEDPGMGKTYNDVHKMFEELME